MDTNGLKLLFKSITTLSLYFSRNRSLPIFIWFLRLHTPSKFLFSNQYFGDFVLSLLLPLEMVQKKVVLKILAMNDEKTKQKAIEAVAEIYGIDSIAADLKEQKMTVIGEMDTVAIAKKLRKIGKIDILSVGPAKEEKKDDKKDDKKGDKK